MASLAARHATWRTADPLDLISAICDTAAHTCGAEAAAVLLLAADRTLVFNPKTRLVLNTDDLGLVKQAAVRRQPLMWAAVLEGRFQLDVRAPPRGLGLPGFWVTGFGGTGSGETGVRGFRLENVRVLGLGF